MISYLGKTCATVVFSKERGHNHLYRAVDNLLRKLLSNWDH